MADIVLSTVDLDVFGGPTTLDVSVDFGAQGERGSLVYSGSGDPAIFLSGQEVKLNDLYINTDPGQNFYGWLYQYLEEVGNPQWVKILQLNPSQYSIVEAVDFSAGSTIGTAIIDIPISNITADTLVSISDFIIRYSIEGSNPIASSFTPTLYTDTAPDPDVQYLRITIEGIEYSSGSWTDLTGIHDVHLFISYSE